MSEIVDGLRAVTVHVTDLDKSRAFYAQVLGLEEDPPIPNFPRLSFRIPGTSTRLTMHIQGPDEGGREPGTVTGVMFHSTDPRAACEMIRQRGGTVTHEPWSADRGGVTVIRAVIADPDGNEFLLSSA